MRKIDDILHFRQDISPFLVHLTRSTSDNLSAHDVLLNIIRDRKLLSGSTQVSDAKFGTITSRLLEEDKKRYFAAICLTETPLSEAHCLLDIAYRNVNLEPYGLVFLKKNLSDRGVSPVIYLNNELGDMNDVASAFCSLIATNREAAEKLLPLISVFGKKLQPLGAAPQPGRVDFRWEREWRYPFARGPLLFSDSDVFIGLCPDNEKEDFEALFPGVSFIDPQRNMKWYATKLIDARRRCDLKDSVV